MITVKLTGAIHTIFPVEFYGQNFKKRVFWLKEINVQKPTIWSVELHQDDVVLGEKFKNADLVECQVEVVGRMVGNTGSDKVFNALKCIGIKHIE